MVRYLLEGLAVYVVIKQCLVNGRITQTERGKKNGMRPRLTLDGGGGGVQGLYEFSEYFCRIRFIRCEEN